MGKTKYWTPERTELLKKLYPTASREDIEKTFPEKKWPAIRQYAHTLKINRHRAIGWLDEQKELIKIYFPRSHAHGLTTGDIEILKREFVMKVNNLSMSKGISLKSWHDILAEATKMGLEWNGALESTSSKKKGKGVTLEEQFITFIKERPREIEEISKFLNRSSKNSIQFIDELRKKGYPIETDSTYQRYFWQESAVRGGSTSLPSLTRNTFKILTLSDINIGNRAQQLTLLHTLYQLVNTGFRDEERGLNFRDVDMVVVLGNMLAGHQRKGENELFIEGFEVQTDYAIEHYPVLSNGLKTYVLSGPAELDINKPKRKEEARDALQKICLAREDMVHLGALGHTLKINGTEIEIFLAHTASRRSRSLYTKSIPLQYVTHSFDDLSSLRKGKKRPAIIILGGYHVFMEDPPTSETEERYALLIPSFCDPISSYRDREKQGATPTIGFMVSTIHFDDEKKRIIRVEHEPHFWTNHQIERDYLAISQSDTDGTEDDTLTEDEAKVLEWLNTESLTAGEISRRLNIPKQTVKKELMVKLERRNIFWNQAEKKYILERAPRKNFAPIPDIDEFIRKIYTKRVRRVVYSDTHFGSLWEQRHIVEKIGKIIEASGVKLVQHCGDVLDGENLYGPKHKRNVYLFSSLAQRQHAAEMLPKVPGVITHVITGSHDMVFHTQSGEDPILLLSDERPDIVYLGPYEGISRDPETGIKHILMHPSGGVPKGMSYRIQGIIDMLSAQIDNLDDDVQGLFVGHLHIALAMFWRGVFSLLVPCCQGRTEYLVQKGLHSRTGCWEIEQTVDEYNDPTRVKLIYYAVSPKKYIEEARLVLAEEVKK